MSEVVQLHRACEDDLADKYDRAIIAVILIALYGRCRHSDLAFAARVEQDLFGRDPFLELNVLKHKTARSAVTKSQLLPIVCPGRGIHGRCWITAADKALCADGRHLQGDAQGPLVRAPSVKVGGAPCVRGLLSKEITSFLRTFFRNEPDACALSSHSLKATALSWAAKYGLSKEARSILGRHACATLEAHAIYARDLSFDPVSKLQRVIDEISKGTFSPDSNRSRVFEPTVIKVEVESDEGIRDDGTSLAWGCRQPWGGWGG